MRRLIVDADGIIYKCSYAHELEIPYYDDEDSQFDFEGEDVYLPQYIALSVNPITVWESFWRKIRNLSEQYQADETLVTITDSSENFRLSIDPTYKGNRVHSRKPLAVRTVRNELAKRDDVYFRPHLEADDICGILMTLPQNLKDENILWSPDKDLLGIPGLHTGHSPDKHKVFPVTKEEARRFHLLQTVMGDTTDGYPGIKGIGESRAKAWYNKEGWTWESAVVLAEKNGMTEDALLVQARLAKMLEFDYYNFDKKEPILWTP
jgi:DNA polymerase I